MLINKNKLKSFVLAILVLTSLIQVGILWDYQTYRVPFSYISNIFISVGAGVSNEIDVLEQAKKEIYKPYRLSVSNGDTHWLIERDEKIKSDLFDEINGYLKRIFSQQENEKLSKDLWPELIIKKNIVIEFKSGINVNLLKFFLKSKGSLGGSQEVIQKILVSPYEDINNNNTIYVLGSGGLYKYVVPFNRNGITKNGYSKIMSDLGKNTNLLKYKTFREIDPNNVISSKLPFFIPKATLCVVQDRRKLRYPILNYSIKPITEDISEIATALLGNEKESFDRYIESDAIAFKNINNIYRLYNDGLLEFKYIPGAEEQEKGDIGAAFEKAYFFISRVKNSLIDSESELYLKKVKDDNLSYFEFVFDYQANGLPVYVDFEEKGRDKEPLKDALIIRVDSKRIIECRWYIIDIEKTRISKEYDVHFQSMLDEFSQKYDKQVLRDFVVSNITRAYLINDAPNKHFPPVWIIENQKGEYYNANLSEEKD